MASALGLILAAPIMLLVALAVRLTSRGPVLYHQRRVGQHGLVFALHKFRSMRADAEAETGAVWATSGDARVTPIGRFLRKTRLDELPQLWNVLLGDMSLVGPAAGAAGVRARADEGHSRSTASGTSSSRA